MHTYQQDDEMENDAARWRNENRARDQKMEGYYRSANVNPKWVKMFVNKRTGVVNNACAHVGLAVDNTCAERKTCEMPMESRYVGWHDPRGSLFFVAVWNYLKTTVDDEEAVELATDIALENGYTWCGRAPDYVL